MVLSVGTKSAVRDAEPSAPGVHEHVALPPLDETDEHPEIVEPPDLKVSVPSCETVAVIFIETPIGVELTPPARARETVGLSRATAIVKLEVEAVAELLSVTVMMMAKLPAVDGVPEITPEDELSRTPEGNDPVVRVNTFPPEPPDEERVSVNAEL